MSASPLGDPAHISYPALVSADPQGIRVAVVGGKLVGEDAEPIRNDYLQYRLARPARNEGLDGTLQLLDGSGLDDKKPRFFLSVFDLIDLWRSPYEARLARLIERLKAMPNVRDIGVLRSVSIGSWGAGERIWGSRVPRGPGAGVVLRNPRARYYFGRTPAKPFVASCLRF